MDPVASLAMAAGLSWASGIRLYAVLFISGALHALGIVTLPSALQGTGGFCSLPVFWLPWSPR